MKLLKLYDILPDIFGPIEICKDSMLTFLNGLLSFWIVKEVRPKVGAAYHTGYRHIYIELADEERKQAG